MQLTPLIYRIYRSDIHKLALYGLSIVLLPVQYFSLSFSNPAANRHTRHLPDCIFHPPHCSHRTISSSLLATRSDGYIMRWRKHRWHSTNHTSSGASATSSVLYRLSSICGVTSLQLLQGKGCASLIISGRPNAHLNRYAST
jgi:hypothetical protein